MAARADEYRRWWQLAAPVVKAGRLDRMEHGIGLESAAWANEFLGAADVPPKSRRVDFWG